MRDGDITIKNNRELLAELLDISEDVFETLTLREIMMTPQAIMGLGEKEAEKYGYYRDVDECRCSFEDIHPCKFNPNLI